MGQRYDAMAVREYQAGNETKTAWTRIGAAFTNKNGSIGIQLDAFPVNGKIILQVPLSKEEIEERQRSKRGQYTNRRVRGQSEPQRPEYPGGEETGDGFPDE